MKKLLRYDTFLLFKKLYTLFFFTNIDIYFLNEDNIFLNEDDIIEDKKIK